MEISATLKICSIILAKMSPIEASGGGERPLSQVIAQRVSPFFREFLARALASSNLGFAPWKGGPFEGYDFKEDTYVLGLMWNGQRFWQPVVMYRGIDEEQKIGVALADGLVHEIGFSRSHRLWIAAKSEPDRNGDRHGIVGGMSENELAKTHVADGARLAGKRLGVFRMVGIGGLLKDRLREDMYANLEETLSKIPSPAGEVIGVRSTSDSSI